MSITHRLITDTTELASYREAWQSLLSRSVDPQVTRSPAWLLTWWDTFGSLDGRALRAHLFFEKTKLVGLIPLVARRVRHRGSVTLARLELMGSGEDEREEICSDYIGPIVARGDELAVANLFADKLLADGNLGWDELVMPAMSGDSPTWMPIAAALRAKRLRVDVSVTNGCPYIPLPTSFEAYLASLSPSRRHLVRRSLSDFEKWNGAPAELERATDAATLCEGSRALTLLHVARWASAGNEGVFSAPRFRAFHDAVMPELLSRGQLELVWVRGRGEPIAAVYGLNAGGCIQVYQSGRLVDLPKELRPGIVSHALAIQSAIERGLREYDFLAGASRYKTELALSTRILVRLRATRGTIRETARRASDVAVDAARLVRDAWSNRLSHVYKRKEQR